MLGSGLLSAASMVRRLVCVRVSQAAFFISDLLRGSGGFALMFAEGQAYARVRIDLYPAEVLASDQDVDSRPSAQSRRRPNYNSVLRIGPSSNPVIPRTLSGIVAAEPIVYAFSRAPIGTRPFSTYRHRAIASLRASATIPTFLPLAPPSANRRQIPFCEFALGLVAQPRPCDLHEKCARMLVPCLADPLVAHALPACIGRRSQPEVGNQMPAVGEGSVKHLRHEQCRAQFADTGKRLEDRDLLVLWKRRRRRAP